MPKYMLEVSYTLEGARGLLKDGGTKRRQAAQALAQSLGGTVESFYYAFGDADALVIVDLPDAASAAAASLALATSGAVTGKTIVLFTPEEMDAATKKSSSYTPPGH
jgi:uncharacterized protein with GYD domain